MKRYLYLLFFAIFFSCQIENYVFLKPVMVSDEPTNILSTSAEVSGYVLGEGGKNVSEYGAVVSLNNPPTVNDIKVKYGEGKGSFTEIMKNLEQGSTYYYSAYGINEEGIGYGDVFRFTTNAKAECSPAKNTFKINSDLVLPNGDYNNGAKIEDGNYGGDYSIVGSNFSSGLELQIHFVGKPEDLLPGSYQPVGDIDYLNKNKKHVVVAMWHNGQRHFLKNYESKVYVEKGDASNELNIILCDALFKYNTNYKSYDAKVTSNFTLKR